MNRIRWVLFSLSAAGTILVSPPALPCSCVDTPTVEENLENRSAIFLGTVSSISVWEGGTRGCDLFLVRFTMLDSWKGDLEESVEVLTEQSSACCGVGFVGEETYLVYADDFLDTGKLSTHDCIGTKHAAQADEDIALLNALTPTEIVSWGWLKARLPRIRIP